MLEAGGYLEEAVGVAGEAGLGGVPFGKRGGTPLAALVLAGGREGDGFFADGGGGGCGGCGGDGCGNSSRRW